MVSNDDDPTLVSSSAVNSTANCPLLPPMPTTPSHSLMLIMPTTSSHSLPTPSFILVMTITMITDQDDHNNYDDDDNDHNDSRPSFIWSWSWLQCWQSYHSSCSSSLYLPYQLRMELFTVLCVLSISTNVNNSCSKFLLHHKCNPGQLRTTITIQSQNKESSSNSRGVFLINANLIIIS